MEEFLEVRELESGDEPLLFRLLNSSVLYFPRSIYSDPEDDYRSYFIDEAPIFLDPSSSESSEALLFDTWFI